MSFENANENRLGKKKHENLEALECCIGVWKAECLFPEGELLWGKLKSTLGKWNPMYVQILGIP